MASVPEQLVYSFFNVFPYTAMLLATFRGSYRFSTKKTFIIMLLFVFMEMAVFVANDMLSTYQLPYMISILSLAMTVLRVLIALAAIDAEPGRIICTLLIVKNAADAATILGKCTEGIFFPQRAMILYSWSHYLCLILVQIPLCLSVGKFLVKYYSRSIRDAIGTTMWHYLWIVPALFLFIWNYVFAVNGTGTALEKALDIRYSLFLIMLVCGQMFIYFCISELVMQSGTVLELEIENKRLEEKGKQYTVMQDHIRDISILKHDLRHRLLAMAEMAETGDMESLKKELGSQAQYLDERKISYCSNSALNLLLVYYADTCRKRNIEFAANTGIPEHLPLNDMDITVLFGNLLENAADAAKEADEKKRYVHFIAKYIQNQIVITIENTYGQEPRPGKDGIFLSTKHTGKGIGLHSSRVIVERYGGTLTTEFRDKVFLVSIILPANGGEKQALKISAEKASHPHRNNRKTADIS